MTQKMSNCFCGNQKSFENCCQIYINGIEKAPSAETLMRSRYSAFATQAVDYLIATTHVSTRKFHKKSDILEWSKSNQWLKLEVIEATDKKVTFKAYYLDFQLNAQIHYEKSTFKNENGSWFYVDGEF